MRKTALLVLAGVMCLGITACGANESVSNSKSGVASESGATENTESSEKSSQETKNSSDVSTAQKKSDSDSPTEFLKDATIEETVLYDENNIKITATDLTYGNYSAEISVNIENGTDKNLSFISGSLGYSCNSVNGYMIQDGYLNSDVAAGKSANETVEFSYDELLMYGINELADIELGIEISDEDYNRIYTGGRQILTSAAETYEYREDSYRSAITNDTLMNAYDYSIPYFTDERLLEQDGLEVLSAGIIEQKDGATALLLEAKNTSEQAVRAVTRNISVNGLTVYGFDWSSDYINTGKTCVITLELDNLMDKNCYEAYGISEYGEISLELVLEDTDGNEIGTPAVISVSNPNVKAGFDDSGKEVYNANDIRIIMKEIVEAETDYSDDMYALFIVENNSGEEIIVDYSYDSLSLNNVMMDALSYSSDINGGSNGIFKLELMSSDLEKQGISSADEINDIEFALEIRDTQYNTIDEPVISVNVSDN